MTPENKITVEQPKDAQLKELDVSTWPIWTKEASTFDWHYDDKETCYLLEGEVRVKTAKEEVAFAAGDLVTFPKGLDCTWEITKAVKKHYRFG